MLCHGEHVGDGSFFLLSLACFPVERWETMLHLGRNDAAEQQTQVGHIKHLGDPWDNAELCGCPRRGCVCSAVFFIPLLPNNVLVVAISAALYTSLHVALHG